MIYNYITTNKLNGKQYVGMHSTGKRNNDSYLGSGRFLKRAIKKYGKENFKREILCFCRTMEEAYSYESVFIKKYNTISPNGYNLSPAGGLGFKESFSDEIRKNMRDNHADFSGENHPLFGKTHTEESKKKNSETKKAFYQTEEGLKARKAMSDAKKGKPAHNKGKPSPMKGKSRPKEVGEKIRKGLTGKSHSEERKQKNREAQLKRMANPKIRQKAVDGALRQWQDPEFVKNNTGENYRHNSRQKIA
jgi:group I intron endonuclease